MNGSDRLERELSTWFADTAAPRVPDYTADILQLTAATPQRPRWSFPTRWLPAAVVPRLPHGTLRRAPWRTVALLALLGLLLAAGVALYVGSRPRLPAPFGLASNGLVAYSEDGDIWTVDPLTGVRNRIVGGDPNDIAPRFSPDGTRIAFLHSVPSDNLLAITRVDGSDMVVSRGLPLVNADSDSIAWSPHGQWVAVAADGGGDRTTYLVDSTTGVVRDLETRYIDVEMYWRPPDGRQLMYMAGHRSPRRLVLVSVADGIGREVPLGDPGADLRLGGWTLDGERFIVHRSRGQTAAWTELLDPETGNVTTLQIGFGRLSNDGERIAGFRSMFGRQALCVMPVTGGPCTELAAGAETHDPEHAAGLRWSPDDRWIIVYPQDDTGWRLLDPDGGPSITPVWTERGVDSWQRVAP